MNNKGITVQTWVILSLMFSAITGLFFIMIVGFQANQLSNGVSGVNITDPVIASHYSDLDSNLQDINNSVSAINQPGGLTLASGFQAFFGGTVAVLNIALGSIGAIPLMFVSFATDFGIDATIAQYVFAVGAAILTILVIFAILNASKTGGRI